MVVRNIEQVPVYLRTYSVYYALTQQQRLPWTSCDLRYEFVLLLPRTLAMLSLIPSLLRQLIKVYIIHSVNLSINIACIWTILIPKTEKICSFFYFTLTVQNIFSYSRNYNFTSILGF